ncbi:MAG TPA: hypothetical protein VLJ88_03145 [Propionibacteriaceae bacterium]|nr:hypothetical protein [Propionibacteriaceae bacterium]
MTSSAQLSGSAVGEAEGVGLAVVAGRDGAVVTGVGDAPSVDEGVAGAGSVVAGEGGPDATPQPAMMITNMHPRISRSARISPRWPHRPIEH